MIGRTSQIQRRGSRRSTRRTIRRSRPPCRRSDCSSSTEGWGPLCKFLGKEVPDEPFPFVNETEDLNKARKVMVFVSYAWLPGALAVTAVVARVCLSRLGR